jgi:hypothetical protein
MHRALATNRVRALLLLGLAGCQPLAPPVVDTSERDAIVALESRVNALATDVGNVDKTLAASAEANAALAAEVTEHSKALGRVETALVELPTRFKDACPPPPAPVSAECPAQEERIPVAGDKLVVGLRERVVLEPPGADLVARIDTGVLGNSLYVNEIVEFERDGDNWVRFKLAVPGEAAPHEVERALRARPKSVAADAAPRVVQLRLRLADVTDSYDFTLVEQTPKDYQVRLGRRFLRDMALVDVSKRFLQPRPTARSNGR